jgi:hypothetical protein
MKFAKIRWHLIAMMILLTNTLAADARTWTDLEGNSWEGYLVRVELNLVSIIEQPSGKITERPFLQFSLADRAYIKRETPKICTLEISGDNKRTTQADKKTSFFSRFTSKKTKELLPLATDHGLDPIQAANKLARSADSITPLPRSVAWTALSASITSTKPTYLFLGMAFTVLLLTGYIQLSLRIFKINDSVGTGVLTAALMVALGLAGCVILSMFGLQQSHHLLPLYQGLALFVAGVIIIRIIYDLPIMQSVGINILLGFFTGISLLAALALFQAPLPAIL